MRESTLAGDLGQESLGDRRHIQKQMRSAYHL